jgi:DNA-binding NarL/FixJ family response regulator
MDLLSVLLPRNSRFVRLFALWFLSSRLDKSVAFAFRSKLLLVSFLTAFKRKQLVVALVDTGEEIQALCRRRPLGLLVCGEDLVDMRGDDLITSLREISPETRSILIVPSNNHRHERFCSYQSDVVVAEDDIGHPESPLRRGLLAALTGTSYRSPSILGSRDNFRGIALTARENELLGYYAQGLSLREASVAMGCTYQSAKTYSRDLMAKLKVGNRLIAVQQALELGLVSSNTLSTSR